MNFQNRNMLFAWILSVWMLWRNIDACVHSQCICNDNPRGNIYNCKSALLTEVPSNFHAETYVLTLLDNDISWLNNDTFDNYVQLWSLDLSRNGLKSLPKNVFSKNTALEFLSINVNKLNELPEDVFSNNLALVSLNLELNCFTNLPIDVFSKNVALKSLKLGWNNLTILPTNLFVNNIDLTELSVRDNLISSLPSDVFKNNLDLSKVYFDRNPIVYISADLFDNNKNLGSLQLFCYECFNCKCISVSVWNWIKKRKNDVMDASFACGDRSILPSDKTTVTCDDDRITLHSASTELSEQLCLCQETTTTNQSTNQTSESPFRYQTSELRKAKTNFHISTMQTLEQHPKTESIKTYSVNSTEKQSKRTTSEISTVSSTDFFSSSTISQGATMTFDTSENTPHQTMQTLEQHPKTDITKQYSVNSTEKQRKQTTSEISTMYTTDLTSQTKQHFSISTISQEATMTFDTSESTPPHADSRDTIYKTIATIILGVGAATVIIAVLRRLKGYYTTLRKIRHGDALGAEEVNNCLYDSIEFISSLNDDNSNQYSFRNIPPRFQHFMRLDVAYHREFSRDTIIQTKLPSPDTKCTIEKEC